MYAFDFCSANKSKLEIDYMWYDDIINVFIDWMCFDKQRLEDPVSMYECSDEKWE